MKMKRRRVRRREIILYILKFKHYLFGSSTYWRERREEQNSPHSIFVSPFFGFNFGSLLRGFGER